MGCLIASYCTICACSSCWEVFAASRVPGGSDDPALGYFYCSGAAVVQTRPWPHCSRSLATLGHHWGQLGPCVPPSDAPISTSAPSSPPQQSQHLSQVKIKRAARKRRWMEGEGEARVELLGCPPPFSPAHYRAAAHCPVPGHPTLRSTCKCAPHKL